MNANRFGWVAGVLIAALLVGCAADQAEDATYDAYITGGNLEETDAGTLNHFDIEVEEAGDPVGIAFRGALVSGAVTVQLTDDDGEVIWQREVDTAGSFAINEVVEPPQAGVYHLGLAWDDAVDVQYAMYWKAGEIIVPVVEPIALIGGIGMILVAIGCFIFVILNSRAWGYLGLGVIAWIVTVMLKFAWAIPTNTPIFDALHGSLPEAVSTPIFNVYVGLLTGIFEVGLTWLLLRNTRLGRASWRKVLAFGIGFGAVEALMFGVSSAATVASGMIIPAMLPLEVLDAIALANDPLFSLAPVVERLAVVLVHVFANALLFYGVAMHQKRWFWYAFAYKSAIDVVAAYAQTFEVSTVSEIWIVEAIILVFGAAGLIGVRWLRDRYPADAEHPTPTSPVDLGSAARVAEG